MLVGLEWCGAIYGTIPHISLKRKHASFLAKGGLCVNEARSVDQSLFWWCQRLPNKAKAVVWGFFETSKLNEISLHA